MMYAESIPPGTSLTAFITLAGVLVTGLCTIVVARIATRTHTQVRSSNGTTTAQTVEAMRAFQIAHDIDDERRFMDLYSANDLPLEKARSLARDALVTERRVTERQKDQGKGGGHHPFGPDGEKT